MIVYVYAIENIRLRDFFPLSSERTEKKTAASVVIRRFKEKQHYISLGKKISTFRTDLT